jgi:hypothetical protein
MIELFDETLRELIRREVVNGSQVEVSLEAPTREWAARRNAPTVNLYLYDIRDDLVRREVHWEQVREANGRVLERRPPARRFRLSYLVTAWTQRPEDEHRLLSACLAAFLRHETLPARDLAGALAEQPFPVELTVALPPGQDRSIADVWSALGGELKPSLDLVASVPFAVNVSQVAGPPVLEEPRIRVAGTGGAAEEARTSRSLRGPVARPTRPAADETVSGGSSGRPGRVIRLHDTPHG